MGHIINRYDFDTLCAGFLRLLDNRSLYERYKKFLDSSYFYYNDSSKHIRAFRKLIDLLHQLDSETLTSHLTIPYFEQYMVSHLMGSESNDEAKALFYKIKSDDGVRTKMADDGCFTSFLDYLKITQMAKGSAPFYTEYQAGNINEAVETMRNVLNDIAGISAPDDCEFDPRRITEYLGRGHVGGRAETLYLGCDQLDTSLGGFETQTLNLFISITNGGKTMMSHHIIKRCIESRMYVYVTVVEDRLESFTRRIVAALTGIPTRRLKDSFKNLSSQEMGAVEEAQAKIAEFVKVDFVYGQSIDAVHKRKVDYDIECRMKKRPVPLVDIVDYTGHIASKSIGDKMHEKMRNAFAARKDFALKYNKIAFDFAQINREGNKRLVDHSKMLTQADLAGSYDLAQVCDNIISINRNEMDQTQFAAQLHVCKARDGMAGTTFRIKTEFHMSRYNMTDAQVVSGPVDFHKNQGGIV